MSASNPLNRRVFQLKFHENYDNIELMPEFNFSEKEKKVLDFWEDRKIFEKSQELRKKAKRFVFFEGPPTANGLPHIGHFLTRVYKDLYGRYKTMRGFYV